MPPKAKLTPIDPQLVPFQVGEKVAFHDLHDDERVEGMYGRIEEIGLDSDGKLALDLAVIDPFTGELKDPPIIYRAGMEDIQ